MLGAVLYKEFVLIWSVHGLPEGLLYCSIVTDAVT